MRIAVLLVAALVAPVATAAQQPLDTAVNATTAVHAPEPAPPVRLPDAELQERLRERVSTGRNKGITVAVLDPDGTHFFSAGVTRDSAGAPVDERTVFEIGSVTKVLTALLLAEMVERSELRLENSAAMYLPDMARMPSEGGDSITLLHLATHTSGLPRLPTNISMQNLRNPYAAYAAPHLYAFLGSHALQRRPGEQYEYSNLGFGLLGHLLSLRGGSTFQALLLERVTRPLGMRETMIVLGPSLQQRLATGHDALGEVTPGWDFDALAGGGAVRSTVSDMSLLLRAVLDVARDETEDDQPITRAIRTSIQPHMEVQGGRAVMGLGWHMIERGGRRLILHNGRTGGYASFVALDPARNTGVVLLTNSSAPIDDLGFSILLGAP